MAIAPVLDAHNEPLVLPPDFVVTDEFRVFMSVRVPALNCPHYMFAYEHRAGFDICESCARGCPS